MATTNNVLQQRERARARARVDGTLADGEALVSRRFLLIILLAEVGKKCVARSGDDPLNFASRVVNS